MKHLVWVVHGTKWVRNENLSRSDHHSIKALYSLAMDNCYIESGSIVTAGAVLKEGEVMPIANNYLKYSGWFKEWINIDNRLMSLTYVHSCSEFKLNS